MNDPFCIYMYIYYYDKKVCNDLYLCQLSFLLMNLIMTHDHAKDLCASALGSLRIYALHKFY